MPELPPLPPPRPRAPSAPDGELVREVIALSAQLGTLRADVDARFARLEAAGRTETLKILSGAVVSVVLAVVGARAATPTTPPPAPVVARSAFDRALDACRALPEGNRGECVVQVLAQSTSAGP